MYITIPPYVSDDSLDRIDEPDKNKILIRIYYKNKFSLTGNVQRVDIDDLSCDDMHTILSLTYSQMEKRIKKHCLLRWYHNINSIKLRHTRITGSNLKLVFTNHPDIQRMYLDTWSELEKILEIPENIRKSYDFERNGDGFIGFSFRYIFDDLKLINWLKLTNQSTSIPHDSYLVIPYCHLDKIKYL